MHLINEAYLFQSVRSEYQLYLYVSTRLFLTDLTELLITGRNEVLAKVILSQACVCPQGGCLLQIFGGGVCSKFFWGGLLQIFRGGVSATNFRGGLQFSEYGQRSAGTHPTGMHSCCENNIILYFILFYFTVPNVFVTLLVYINKLNGLIKSVMYSNYNIGKTVKNTYTYTIQYYEWLIAI